MRKDILNKIHDGHQGIAKCRARIRDSVWWPGVSKDIEDLIKRCQVCLRETTNKHEPLMPSEYPERPWQKVAMDLFHLEKSWYLLLTDYYSRYPEIALLQSLKESEVIKHTKSIFARHGTPETACSDNGSQFGTLLTSAFTQFSKDWGFTHVTSSPKFPQSNGFVESAVKIIKRALKKSEDPYKALQSYRATPLSNGFSPAELLMGRRIQTSVPIATSKLYPKIPNRNVLLEREECRRSQQKQTYDRRHNTRELPELNIGDKVWVVDLRRTGVIKCKHKIPRSYIITDKREIRRNRFHLVPLPNEDGSSTVYEA